MFYLAQPLITSTTNHHPTRLNQEGEEFVLQYEVKMEEPLTCGGAYVKLFAAETAPSVGEGEFDNETPYILMFGPDRCGATNKVHFILRHRNPVSGAWEEKHAEAAPQVKVDKKSHVYTLVSVPAFVPAFVPACLSSCLPALCWLDGCIDCVGVVYQSSRQAPDAHPSFLLLLLSSIPIGDPPRQFLRHLHRRDERALRQVSSFVGVKGSKTKPCVHIYIHICMHGTYWILPSSISLE